MGWEVKTAWKEGRGEEDVDKLGRAGTTLFRHPFHPAPLPRAFLGRRDGGEGRVGPLAARGCEKRR